MRFGALCLWRAAALPPELFAQFFAYVDAFAWTLRVDWLGLRVARVDSPTRSREFTYEESIRNLKTYV